MKTASNVAPVVLVCLALAASVFALLEYSGYAESSAQLNARVEALRGAQELAARHPDVFGAMSISTKVDLKSLVQTISSKNGVELVYLNETDRDAGEKAHEINIVARALNVSHNKLVLFLADVEANAGGARFKDLRLRPKAGQGDTYEEAEAILSLRVVRE